MATSRGGLAILTVFPFSSPGRRCPKGVCGDSPPPRKIAINLHQMSAPLLLVETIRRTYACIRKTARR
jgi:hypothetical protein